MKNKGNSILLLVTVFLLLAVVAFLNRPADIDVDSIIDGAAEEVLEELAAEEAMEEEEEEKMEEKPDLYPEWQQFTGDFISFKYPKNYFKPSIPEFEGEGSLNLAQFDENGEPVGVPSLVIARSFKTIEGIENEYLEAEDLSIIKKEALEVACGQGVRLVVDVEASVQGPYQAEFVVFSNGRETYQLQGWEWLDWSDLHGVAETFAFAGCQE